MLTVLLLNLAFAADKPRNPDTKVGWKDLRWGVSKPEGLLCTAPRPGVQLCERKASDDRRIGDLTMDKAVLTFWSDRFSEVQLTTASSDTCDVLLAGLETAYGKGEGDTRSRAWTGDRIAVDFALAANGVGCELRYAYLPIIEEVIEARREALADRAKAAAGDL